jgi:hypothetical protein
VQAIRSDNLPAFRKKLICARNRSALNIPERFQRRITWRSFCVRNVGSEWTARQVE